MPTQPSDASWLQWAIGTLFGLFAAIYGGAIWTLAAQVNTVRDQVRQAEKDAQESAARAGDKIWEAIDGMRKDMAADRALAATDRANIAATMVTRAELERQVDRVVTAFTLHGRMRGGGAAGDD